MFTFVKSGKAFQQPNTEQGIAALIEQLLVVQPELVVLEATGGMEVPAAAALSRAALASGDSQSSRLCETWRSSTGKKRKNGCD